MPSPNRSSNRLKKIKAMRPGSMDLSEVVNRLSNVGIEVSIGGKGNQSIIGRKSSVKRETVKLK